MQYLVNCLGWVGTQPHHLRSGGYLSSNLSGSSKDDSFQREESGIRNPSAGPQGTLGGERDCGRKQVQILAKQVGGGGGGGEGPGGNSPSYSCVTSGAGEGIRMHLNPYGGREGLKKKSSPIDTLHFGAFCAFIALTIVLTK